MCPAENGPTTSAHFCRAASDHYLRRRTATGRVDLMETQQRTDSRHLAMAGDRAGAVARRARTAHGLLDDAWTTLRPAGRLAAIAAATAAVATGLLAGVSAASALTVAAAVPAVVVDVHVRRLPDPLVAAAAVVGIVTSAIAALAGAPWPAGGVTLGALVMGGPILLLHVVSPRSMGFGDVKLGAVLGAALGALHWQLALSGLALAAGLSATVALLTRRDTIPFGPGLLAGALVAIAAHPLLIPERAEAAADRLMPLSADRIELSEEHRR